MVQKQKKETMAPKKEKKRKLQEQNQNQNQNQKKRTSQGRRKIEIKRIENESNRKVTLSKRRKGLFSKGAEICILTGADIAIIAQAENGKISTFGHPDINNVIHRYLNGPNSSSPPTPINAELVDEDRRLTSELEVEKKKLKANMVNNFWWDEPTDNLGVEELEERLESLIELRNNVIAAENNAREMAFFNDDDHQCSSQIVGVSDNVEMEQTTNADELDLSDYFDLEESMLADELMKESQSLNNVDLEQTVASALNDFCSSEDYQSFCNLDSYGSNFSFF